VTVSVAPAASVSPLTLIVCPEKESVPALAVVHPAALVEIGAVQPVGTAMSTSPFETPPVAAVYVNATVFPVDDAETLVVGVVSVPNPSAPAVTVLVNALVAVQSLRYRAVIKYL
jgi:hypothetical protein